MGASTAKQYLRINNKTIIEHTIDVFLAHPQIGDIIVVLHPNDSQFEHLPLANTSLHSKPIHTVVGDSERVDSVMAGLHFVAQQIKASWVLVHDAARPCLQQNDLSALIAQSTCSEGGILAIPVTDTIKQQHEVSAQNSHQPNTIDKTVNRELLWQAQTPQMFPTEALINAIKQGKRDNVVITDEASAMEHCQHTVNLVEGQSSNIKITRPADLALAAHYLQNKLTANSENNVEDSDHNQQQDTL